MTGEELKKRRKKLGLSQERLARELDISTASVARWEQFRDADIIGSGMLPLALKALEERLSVLKGFDLAGAVAAGTDPQTIMKDWFAIEGKECPTDFGVVFYKGWESYTAEKKIAALTDAKRALDHTMQE